MAANFSGMHYLEALTKTNVGSDKSLISNEIYLYSHWDSSVLKIFLEAYSIQVGIRLIFHSNRFGSLLLDLENLVANHSSSNRTPLVVLVDEEALMPGYSLRSDAVLIRKEIEHSLSNGSKQIHKLISILAALASKISILVVPFSLPGFPILPTPRLVESRIAKFRFELRSALSEFQSSHINSVCILDLEQVWHDLTAEKLIDDRLLFAGGWPLSLAATDRLAEAITKLLFSPKEARKIVITDADQTLWKGIVGDDGFNNVSWVAEPDTYRFLIYQKTLNLLMSEGILVAIASKNSQNSIEAVLKRPDLVLNKERLVMQQISFSPKSEMVSQILSKINLLPASAVFVDDSDFELGEVAAAFPEIKCIKFPDDNLGLRKFLDDLRSLFNTRELTVDDRIRVQTTRQAAIFKAEIQKSRSIEEYLTDLKMRAKIEAIEAAQSARAFQLINKTNQFNLTGRRYDRNEWEKILLSNERQVYQLHFQDRYSDYGIVSALLMDHDGLVTDWVLSCRVFGRTIEHYMLNFIRERIQKDKQKTLSLMFQDTGKNYVVYDFLKEIALSKISGNRDRVWMLKNNKSLVTFVSLA